MIYVSKIGETHRYEASTISEDGERLPRVRRSAACDACRKIAKAQHPRMQSTEPVRCYHVVVRGLPREAPERSEA